jgi:hypothetical protein
MYQVSKENIKYKDLMIAIHQKILVNLYSNHSNKLLKMIQNYILKTFHIKEKH